MNALTIGASKIHQIDDLYSLNDLHKASGSSPAHRPNQFLRNEQTQALIAELETAQIRAVKTSEGRNGGTYACRELVIAYAAWISPSFHLQVIRVFLAAINPSAFDWGAEIEAANYDLKEPLPPEVQDAIEARAWVLMPGVHQLLRRHLERRVAGNLKGALKIIERTSLSSAIAPAHHREVETVLMILDAMIGVADQARREMRGLAERKITPWVKASFET